jgi:hypothetical protein
MRLYRGTNYGHFALGLMAASRIISVTTAVLVLSLTGCTARLPSSAEQLLLRRLGATKLFAVNELKYRTVEGFDYLGVFASFEVTSGFEALYHPEIVLRKKHSEVEWSNADLFSIGSKSLASVFHLPDPEFIAALYPLLDEQT